MWTPRQKSNPKRDISPYMTIDKGIISRYDYQPEPRGRFFMSASKADQTAETAAPGGHGP
jgi:hypothetical protein